MMMLGVTVLMAQKDYRSSCFFDIVHAAVVSMMLLRLNSALNYKGCNWHNSK